MQPSKQSHTPTVLLHLFNASINARIKGKKIGNLNDCSLLIGIEKKCKADCPERKGLRGVVIIQELQSLVWLGND